MSSQNPVFIPGPTNIPERLRHAVNVPTIDHRSADFGRMFRPLFAGVKEVLKTKTGEVILFPATGTAGWEAAISNTLSPGDRVLACRHGMFSHRWIDMCQRHALDVQTLTAPWGAGAPADAFQAALAEDRDHRIKAVLVTHNETATGVRSDVAAVRRAMDAAGHPAMLFVDGVSSIASMDFRMDEWGVDVAITGSQKGFMLPAGLAIVGVSPKALAAMETAKLPRCFLDFRDMLATNAKGGYPYTPPVQLLYGLGASLDMLRDEGLENVFERHRRIAEGVRRAVSAWGMNLCAQSPDLYSETVSAIVTPEGFDSTKIVTHSAEKYGVAFGVGLGEVAGKVFRIGHLGSLTDVMMLAGLATAEMAMADLGLQVRLGSGVAAAQDYYRTTEAAAVSRTLEVA
jgi:alanine-glyoxylate transaminase/serine-glyoxylate transaminase/serine-pyruvate transaminase